MKSLQGNVLIIVENLPVPFDRRVWLEATTLVAAGYHVSIICPADKGYEKTYEEINGIHIYRHPLPFEATSAAGYFREYTSALWHEWRLAGKVLREQGFDVIHICNPPDLIFLVALWFKVLHRKRVIFDQHDLNPELYESKFTRRDIFYWGLRCAEACTYATADGVISTNESYKAIALKRGHKKEKSVTVVRSGPRLDNFNPVPPNDAYRHGRKNLIGYLGVMGDQDGVDHLVRAAHELIINRKRTDLHFCLIGSGSMLESLKKLSAELKLEDYIEFTGRISNDVELIARISTCDVCVCCDPLNPLNDKSTMNKILEYMALKRPIVQYDLVEGRRSALEASLYAEPNNIKDLADKIELLLADPETCKKMGEYGRKRMEDELEWKHQAPKLLSAYERVLNKK